MITIKSAASIAASAALIALATATPTTPVFAAGASSLVACYGVNTCKGTSDCKSAKNDCKGQNSCKGQGFKDLTAKQCKAQGGSLTAPQ